MKARKPRVLVLASTFPRWAADSEPRFILDLCCGLGRYFDVHALVPHAEGSARREILEGVTVHRFRYAPARLEKLAYQGGMLARLRRNPLRVLFLPVFVFAMVVNGVRLLRTGRFVAIHAHWIVPQGLAAALIRNFGAPRRCRLVCTAHGGDLFALNSSILRWLKKYILTRCDAVTVVSHAMVATAQRVLPAGAAIPSVIPMGTDLKARFTPTSETQRDAHTLLFVGRLVEKKGVAHLIDAMTNIGMEVPGTRLLIVGDGPLRNALVERAEKLDLGDAITFLGAVSQSNLPALYRQATAAVFPFVVAHDGDQEGLGLVVVEAMGCGCPVVVSDVPAVRDTVEPGTTGWLVAPAEIGQLADRIIHVLRLDPKARHAVGQKAREHVLRHFDWETLARRYANLLDPSVATNYESQKARAAPVVR